MTPGFAGRSKRLKTTKMTTNTNTTRARMSLNTKLYYIEKFRSKMTDSLPSVAAWWIDGINAGTPDDLNEIWYEVRNEIDWVAKDPSRERGDMPTWVGKVIVHGTDEKGRRTVAAMPPKPAEMHDEENPAYLYSTVWTSLLVKIARGEVDANYMAKVELANRGLDERGVWVGFAKAKRIHGIL
jgi:hypothetical protein